MGTDIYEQVTALILRELEAGTVPWRKPWTSARPRNLASGRYYSGINVLLLDVQARRKGFASPYWVTYRQAKALGGHVLEGQRGSLVTFWKLIERKKIEDGQEKIERVPCLRAWTIFNIAQTSIAAPVEAVTAFEPNARAEAIVKGYPNPPLIEHRGDQAFYDPQKDLVVLPPLERFTSAAGYWDTLFHELTHSTGHSSRLVRPGLTSPSFGSDTYSREELVAECGGAFLCAHAGIVTELANNSSYIQGWLRALRNDRRLIVFAASAAQRAADWILRIRADGEPEN